MARALALMALLFACGGSSSDGGGGSVGVHVDGGTPPPISCPASETCVQATGGDACRPSCDLGQSCGSGQTCQAWAVCCSGPECTAALAYVCCADGGC